MPDKPPTDPFALRPAPPNRPRVRAQGSVPPPPHGGDDAAIHHYIELVAPEPGPGDEDVEHLFGHRHRAPAASTPPPARRRARRPSRDPRSFYSLCGGAPRLDDEPSDIAEALAAFANARSEV